MATAVSFRVERDGARIGGMSCEDLGWAKWKVSTSLHPFLTGLKTESNKGEDKGKH